MNSLLFGLLFTSTLAAAQSVPAPAFTTTCQDAGSGYQPHFCETRDLTMAAPTGQPLTVEGGRNGSITVKGWDGTDVRVRVTVRAWADTEAAAQAGVKAITISTAGSTLQAAVPGKLEGAAVSYEVFVPRQLGLRLSTSNGSVNISGVRADISFHTQNGSVSLADLGGHVTGEAVNGGLHIALSGRQWEGTGLDVATTNGSITWRVPADYSAQLTTRTRNGGLHTTLPTTRSGNQREVQATLGKGGQPIQAVTTNGGVTIKQG